jgi:hypothetical protein
MGYQRRPQAARPSLRFGHARSVIISPAPPKPGFLLLGPATVGDLVRFETERVMSAIGPKQT